MKKTEFKKYFGSANYHADIATFDFPVTTVTSPWIGANAIEVFVTTILMSVQEFQQGVEQNKKEIARNSSTGITVLLQQHTSIIGMLF
jgi:hypothetical protein